MYVVLSQNQFLLITCKYALKLALYFHQNEAPIPGQFHGTGKRHFSMHADARGSLLLYILCVEIYRPILSLEGIFVPAQRHPLGSTEVALHPTFPV